MLSSLPPLGPQNVSSLAIFASMFANINQAHSLVYPSASTFHSNHAPSAQHPNGPRPFGRPWAHHQPRTLLSVLTADENAILNRKKNIRRFGAGWLRPLGVPKTLQGMDDERAEREEQERAANRDFEYYEAHRAAEAEAMARDQEGMAPSEEEQQGLERDLDDDVPDADADAEDEEYEPYEDFDEPDGGWDSGMVAVPTLEEEGDGDYVEGERDLDGDVPEAGSYQHTDTELEDESSEEGEAAAFRGVDNTSIRGVLGNSVFGSSPALRVPGGARRSGSGAQPREN